jgi:hypothetical protein
MTTHLNMAARTLRNAARWRPCVMLHSLLSALIVVLWMTASPVAAQNIKGQDAPEFTAALELWLKDDEATALPQLSALAQDGNQAARVLIGMIDKNAALQGPWLALLSKKERIALLRTTGGLSGTSWLRQVDDVPSVQTWLDVVDSTADIETVLSLVDLGEPRLARAGLIWLDARQVVGFADFADDARFPDAVRYLIWREWQKAGDLDKLATSMNRLHPGNPQLDLLRASRSVPETEDWLMQTELGAPLSALCQAQCQGGVASCLRAGLETLGGYRRVVSLGTPLVSLIPEERFSQSPRGQLGVLRQSLSYMFLSESRLKPIRAIDVCFAELLEDEGQNF